MDEMHLAGLRAGGSQQIEARADDEAVRLMTP